MIAPVVLVKFNHGAWLNPINSKGLVVRQAPMFVDWGPFVI
jgi:hypothetical protein